MRRSSAALLASAAAALAATGCGGGDTDATPRGGGAGPAAVSSNDYVASPTLGRGTAARLFAIPGLGAFRASCTRAGEARISYRVEPGGAGQLVTTASPRGTESNTWAEPGERVSVRIGRDNGPRVDWRTGLLSEGRNHVLTASFTVGRLATTFGCFVTGTAHAANRRR